MTRPTILRLPPHRRVVIGRNITLSAGVLYCLSRAGYYGTINPNSLSGAQAVITADGAALGFWTAVWAAAAALCIADMVNRHTRYGLSILVAIAFSWGICYLAIWAFTGYIDWALLSSAIGWVAPAGLVFGLLLKVTALQDIIRQFKGPRS